MARSMTTTGPTLARPVWAGDFLSRDHLVPGPFKVNPAGFVADGSGRKHIPSGTLLGRTIVERDAGTGFGPADDTDDEIFLSAFDVVDAVVLDDVEMYRPGSQVKENFLPDYATIAADAPLLARLREIYLCTRGAE
jgi:hypothetical protein